MTHKPDFSLASAQTIIDMLGRQLNEIRLSQNLSQEQLAERAGVSRSTLTRLADGRPISLDSFVRVVQALGLSDHLAALLPDPSVRPVERVRYDGVERQRASGQRSSARTAWTWGDEGTE